jgi:putative FmdB family regulatory protein
MPTYPYECQACEHHFEFEMRISLYDSKVVYPCPKCESADTRRIITVPYVTFSGDGWASKNNRVAGQMRQKRARLSDKERDMKGDGFVPQLVPNVEGEHTSTWSDAAKLAQDRGKDPSGYVTRARKEKASTA